MDDQQRRHARLLQEAQRAAQAGRKREARALLQQALRRNPQDYRAWLWLAGVASSAQASLNYVERAEQLAPGNATVARARAWAEHRLAAEASQPAAKSGQAAVQPSSSAKAAPRRAPPEAKERRQPRPVERLAEEQKTRAPEAKKPEKRGSRRSLVFAAAGLALLTVLSLASGFIWRAGNGDLVGEPDAVELAAAGDGSGPVATLVSGYFSPKNPAAVAEDDAGAEAEATATSLPLEPKAMASSKEGNGPRPTWTMTPTPTPTFTPTPTPVPTFVSSVSNPRPAERPPGVGPNDRWIDVNLSAQQLVAYEGDTPVFDTLISSGTYNHPTVTGQFRIWLRFQSQTMDGRRLGYDYYLPNVPYVMYFYQDYALHGTYWHNNFGTPMSHGCVNLPTPSAEWIFNWSTMGTVVNVHY